MLLAESKFSSATIFSEIRHINKRMAENDPLVLC